MIQAFTCHDGPLHRLTDPSSADALRAAVWIDLQNAAQDEIDQVQAATGLTVPSEADVSEIESSSRLAIRDGALYLSMPLIRLDEDGPRTVSASFVLSNERLITVRFAPSRIFETYAEHIPRDSSSTGSSAHIFVGILEGIVDRQADALEQVRIDLDEVSRGIFAMGVKQKGGENRGRRPYVIPLANSGVSVI